MKPSTRIPTVGHLRNRLAPLIALWLLICGSAVAIAGTGKPPTQPRLSPSGLSLTDCSVQVPTNFKAEWSWTDGARLGMVELWQTTGKGGRQTHLVKKRDEAKAPEVSATLDKNSWYRLKVRNYTANADVWLDVDFTTGPGLLPKVSLNANAILICEGSPFELVADIEGCNTTMQWYLNGEAIRGATTPTLRRNASLEQSGDFMVVVSTPAGKRTATCDVEVFPSTEIISQPESAEVAVGESIDLSVEAEGHTESRPLSYQWFKNQTAIPGATKDTLIIPNAQPSDAGSYSVAVTGQCGSVRSDVAEVTVESAIEFAEEPPAMTYLHVGQTLRLAAKAVNATEYQWHFSDDGVSSVPVAGANQSTLSKDQASAAQSGIYWLVASNTQGGQAQSSEATVEVLEPLSATISSKAGTNSIVQVRFSIAGLPQDPQDLKPLSLILLVDGRQLLATNQPANQSQGLLTAEVQLAPGTHHATLLIEDFLGAKLKVTTPIETATAPGVEEPMVRFQRTESGLRVSWPKEFVLGEEPGQWQLLASFDLEQWYSAYFEEDEPLDLGNSWGVTIPWIDADGNSDETGFESETQEPTSEFFRLTPWKPETEVQE